jgi:hypothetical protein
MVQSSRFKVVVWFQSLGCKVCYFVCTNSINLPQTQIQTQKQNTRAPQSLLTLRLLFKVFRTSNFVFRISRFHQPACSQQAGAFGQANQPSFASLRRARASTLLLPTQAVTWARKSTNQRINKSTNHSLPTTATATAN